MGMLANRVAVVTGAGCGIGRATALCLAREGAKVVVADMNTTTGKETVALLKKEGHEAMFHYIDIAKENTIEICMNQVVEQFGRIDILVNNATKFEFGHLKGAGNGSGTQTDRDITAQDWTETLNTNVVGTANCTKHAVKHMKTNELTDNSHEVSEGCGVNRINAGSRGSIINMSSVAAYMAMSEYIPYTASKAAILQLTRCCALDFAEWKIRVNAVCPGPVETPGLYNHVSKLNKPFPEAMEEIKKMVLMGRVGAPQEIANAVAFLASDKASFMTGSTMAVDGGTGIL